MRTLLLALALCAIPSGLGLSLLTASAEPGSPSQIAFALAVATCVPFAIGCILLWGVLYERADRLRMGLPGRRYRQIVRSGATIPAYRERNAR